ncbi:MAG: acetyltransferase [Mogibacterium sp.]|nr:acetyltransferase [Mogibacterium sp.]
MRDIIVIGAGGLGREVAWLIERINLNRPTWNMKGYLDDKEDIIGKKVNGYAVLGNVSLIESFPEAFFVCAVGSSVIREKIVERAKRCNPLIRFATLIDPSVYVSKSVVIEAGSIICINSVVTVDIHIGEHVIINYGSTIGHDAKINDFVTLYPSVNVSGAVTIRRCSEVGVGSQIIQGKTINENSIIGAGAVVTHDVPKGSVVAGVPAKAINIKIKKEEA